MGIFDFFKRKESKGGEAFKCEKCGKMKKKSEGTFVLEGSAFCCKKCCGDASKGEHKQKNAATCEFC